ANCGEWRGISVDPDLCRHRRNGSADRLLRNLAEQTPSGSRIQGKWRAGCAHQEGGRMRLLAFTLLVTLFVMASATGCTREYRYHRNEAHREYRQTVRDIHREIRESRAQFRRDMWN